MSYNIGDIIYIGCNSCITEGLKTPYQDKCDNPFYDLFGEPAEVLTLPWKETFKLIGIEEPVTWERIGIKVLSTGKIYSIYNGYHSTSLEVVLRHHDIMSELAEDLMQLSDQMYIETCGDFH